MGEGLDLPQADASMRATSSTWAASPWPLPAPPAPSWPCSHHSLPSGHAALLLVLGNFCCPCCHRTFAHAALSDCFTVLSSLKQVSCYLFIQIALPWGNIPQYLQIKSFYPLVLKCPSDHSYKFTSVSQCYISSPPCNLAIFVIIITHTFRIPFLCPALF